MPNRIKGNTLKLWEKFEKEVANPRWGVPYGWQQVFTARQRAVSMIGGPDILNVGSFVPGVDSYLKIMRELASAYNEVAFERAGVRATPDGKDFDIVKTSEGGMEGIIPYLIAVGIVVVAGVFVYLDRMKVERTKLEHLAQEKNREFAKYVMNLPPGKRSALKSTAEWIASNKIEKQIDSVSSIAAGFGNAIMWGIFGVVLIKVLGKGN